MKIKLDLKRIFFFQVTALYFGAFYLEVGFSIKPYMFFLALLTVLFFDKIKFSKLHFFEIVMVLFLVYFSFTSLQLRYPIKHIRFILAIILLMLFYFINRSIITKVTMEDMHKGIFLSGIVGVVSSLFYYAIGIIGSGFNYFGNDIQYAGMLIDRSMPRLIGTVSTDPNIYVFFITLFLFYCLLNLNRRFRKLGFFLGLLSIILTFSRGAILSITLTLILYIIMEFKSIISIKNIVYITIGALIFYIVINQFSFDIYGIIFDRFDSIKTDGGSGRDVLWSNAITTFKQHPIFGIGINSTTSYGALMYNDTHYVHNTILEVLSESGLVGITIYSIFLLSLLIRSYKLFKIDKESKFLFFTLISMYIQMFFLSILYSEIFYFVVLLIYWFTVKGGKKVTHE